MKNTTDTHKISIAKRLQNYVKQMEKGKDLCSDKSNLTFVKKQWYQSSPTGKRLYIDGQKRNLDATEKKANQEVAVKPKKLSVAERLAEYLDAAAERGAVIDERGYR